MTTAPRSTYLDAAASAADLLAHPAVADRWDAPSALDRLDVAGLAGHLGGQVTRVAAALTQPVSDPPIGVLDHYARAAWLGADLDADVNVGIRRNAEQEAAAGPVDLVARVRAAVDELRRVLPATPADRTVQLPWGPWSLTLDDFLLTRTLEIAVHGDDLAASVDIATPVLPAPVLEPVLDLLTRLAVRRHGSTAVLRALSRSERSPATIAAF